MAMAVIGFCVFYTGAITATDQKAYNPSSVMGFVPAECVSSTILAATVAVTQGRLTQRFSQACVTEKDSLHRRFYLCKIDMPRSGRSGSSGH
jgi:hypothetical protein